MEIKQLYYKEEEVAAALAAILLKNGNAKMTRLEKILGSAFGLNPIKLSVMK